MGFLENFLVKTAQNTLVKAVDRHMDNTRSVNAVVNNSDTMYRLFIEKKVFSMKRAFYVRDEYENKIYQVKKDAISKKEHLFDKNNNEIAKVEREKHLFSDLEYVIWFDDQKVGTITPKPGWKAKFEIDFNGWHVESSLTRWEYTVYDRNNEVVIRIHDTYEPNKTYVIEYNTQANEIFAILIMMTIDLYSQETD